MKRVLRWCARFCAAICLLLIVPLTAIAFWVFNANQVFFNPDTYQNALHTSFAEGQIFDALLNGLAGSAPRDATDLIHRLPGPALDQLHTQLFPTIYADSVVDNVITALRDWLIGRTEVPRLTIELDPLKNNLSGTSATKLANLLADDLSPCSSSQMAILFAFSQNPGRSYKEFPLCSPNNQLFPTATVQAGSTPPAPNKPSSTPSAKSPRELWIAGFTTGLTLISSKLPDTWTLADQLNTGSPSEVGMLTQTQFSFVRASIWLQQRLLVLLFLIPIGLMFIVIIFVIRTTKRLLRWIGWVLVISGILSLLPIILLSSYLIDRNQVQPFNGPGLALDQLAFNALARGAAQSVIDALSQVILIQVAVLIVIGLLSLILSIIVSPPLNWPPDDMMVSKTPKLVQKASR